MTACHVLVVENDELNRMLMGDILSLKGHTFKTAENGLEAVTLFLNEVFDVVFLDLQMPLLNGYETLKIIRFEDGKKGKRTPVVLLSGSPSSEDFDYHLRKPFSPSDVLAILKALSTGTPVAERPQMPYHPYCEADMTAAFEKTDGHLEFFETLFLKSVDLSKTLLDQINHALNSGDYAKAFESAHALKGTLSIFNVYDAIHTLDQLEQALHADTPPAPTTYFLNHLMKTLQQEINDSITSLSSFIQHKKTAAE